MNDSRHTSTEAKEGRKVGVDRPFSLEPRDHLSRPLLPGGGELILDEPPPSEITAKIQSPPVTSSKTPASGARKAVGH